jgi:redox-sensitive bicupin YhaK (pirin superfamily)
MTRMRRLRVIAGLVLSLASITEGFVFEHRNLGRLPHREASKISAVSNERLTNLSSLNEVARRRSNSSPRSILSLEKDPRLPVWPVVNGVLLWLVGLLSPKLSAQLEHVITGRVCPMSLSDSSPFILLVHHVHSFSAWDPVRYIQRQFILPEGFPSHPHRGFVTLTYILDGAFVHRDSLGQRQVYGTQEKPNNSAAILPHSQWLHTGAGVLHEEMFLNQGLSTRQELFQLWINCPKAKKFDPPFSILLGGDDAEHPTPTVTQKGTSTLVLAGCYDGQCSAAPIDSNLQVLHVKMEANARWECDSELSSTLLYVRQGSVLCDGTPIPTHHRAHLDRSSRKIVLETTTEPADFLFLAGQPLYEPVVQQGSFVLSSNSEVNQAYLDYQTGNFGSPWDHKLSDEDWQQHVRTHPCLYKPDNYV